MMLHKAARAHIECVHSFINVGTLLFFLLQLTGNPVLVLAGSDASITQIEAISSEYGFNWPLIAQYATYTANLLRLDFGMSLASGEPAMAKVLPALSATLLLTVLGMGIMHWVAIPFGCTIGFWNGSGKLSSCVLFVLQNVPGYFAVLVFVQLFAVEI